MKKQQDFMPHYMGVSSWDTMHSAIESQAHGPDHARGGAQRSALGWAGAGRPGEEGSWKPGVCGACPRPAQSRDRCISNLVASVELGA